MDHVDDEDTDLDGLGVLTGTDKNLFSGDYLRHYRQLFAPFRYQNICIMEIGIYEGASLSLWQRYFDKASIVGVDINKDCARFAGDRVQVRIGDVEDPEFLHQLATDFQPTIIIDDGSHRADHQIATFERLLPALLPGGLYIIEDLHFQYAEPDASRLRGIAPMSAIDYFLEIARRRIAASYQNERFRGLERYLSQAVDTIQFIQQTAIIRKRQPRKDLAERLHRVYDLVEKSGHYANWLQIGVLYFEINRTTEAIQCVRKSIELNPGLIPSREWLSVMLERDGNISEAIGVLEPAIELAHAEPELRSRISQRLNELRDRLQCRS